MASNYYPTSNDGRADWWQNKLDNAAAITQLGFTAAEKTSILADAAGGVYLYRTLRLTYESIQSAVIAYADDITDSPDGTPLPAPPSIPAWPAIPAGLATGIEARREQWVGTAKKSTSYSAALAALLKLEAPGDNFDPATYQTELYALTSPSAHTVSGKSRKAGGRIDGINLYGRKEGTVAWLPLGRYTAMPFSALVPVAGSAPENWEFQARAVKRDEEIGLPSDIVSQIVRA